MNRLGHICVVVAALLLFLGVPTLLYVDAGALFPSEPDAVAEASIDLPEEAAEELPEEATVADAVTEATEELSELPFDPDAVTEATVDLPGFPSGEFYVLLNKANHPDTLDQWSAFFTGQDAGDVMSDVRCAVAVGDAGGLRLAQWYRARLPEGRMTVEAVNGLLLASKTEYRLFDAVVLSWEMAEAYGPKSVFQDDGVLCAIVQGE